MTFPSQSQIDVIATAIQLDAKQALLQLKAWNNSLEDAQAKTKLFKEIVKTTAQQMNGDFGAAAQAVNKFSNALGINPALIRQIGKELQQLDAIAQKTLGDTSLKTVEASTRMTLLSSAIQAMATKGKISIEQVTSSLRMLNSSQGTKFGKLGYSDSDIAKAGQAASAAAANAKKLGDESKKAGDQASSAFGKVFNSVNALRIALGAIVSMILFQVIQAVQQLATDSIKQFTEMEDSLWRLVNVERELSKQGVEISFAGMKKGIEDIRKLLPIFSENDVAGLVGKIAISTKELGYSQEQILELSKAIAILNVRSTENEDLNQTASKVITALLSGTTKGVSGLGVQLNDTVIKTKAVEMGLLKASDGLDKLTKQQKDLVKLNIILEGSAGELDNISGYLDTNAAKLKENSAGWDDLKAAIGGFTATIVPALQDFLGKLTDVVNGYKALYVIVVAVHKTYQDFAITLALTGNIFTALKKSIADFGNIFDKTASDLVPKLFAKMPSDAPNWFKNLFGKYIKDVETATDETGKWKSEIEDNEDTLKALEDIDQKVQEIILDAKQAQEDLDIKKKQKQEDLDTEYQRKGEDAAREHAQKLEDINRDYAEKVADVKAKQRAEEKKGEEDLLQKLKELRDKYLLDLEEALHNRDARQVIRLMKEYQLDKQHLLEQKKLDDKQRAEKLADDLRDLELERQRRIDAENLDYKRKLADLAVAKAREQQELELWYKREQEDIQRNIRQKLEKLLAGYIAEEKIHETEQAKIYAILVKYFGKDAAIVDQMVQYMTQRFAQLQGMAGYTPAAPGSLNAQLGLPDKANPFTGNASLPSNSNMDFNTTPINRKDSYAEGGTMIANRPTSVMFGDNGLEMAQFTPLGRQGKDVGKIFGDISGGGASGQIAVLVDLSPDLEARVVTSAMDNVANVVSRVNQRKN